MEAFRARQRSRNRALGLVLAALVVLFFAITIVKMKAKGHL
ncbi:MAG: cytochrome oxidase small assembly protein [Sphingomonadales bacterium]|nr:cytochrome oxidase small assembly protein [Sphingomonadales bacterium]MDE2568552.1 cytochrome oxidase small assembly protein [Sphingomonadales bacterium]